MSPVDMLEELTRVARAEVASAKDTAPVELRHTYAHWMMRFPAQCVVVTEAILWSRSVARALERTDPDVDELKSLLYVINPSCVVNSKIRRLVSKSIH